MPSQTTILVVEDDKFLSKMLSRSLESEGYAVLIAGNGREAIAKATTEKPQLILLDIMLPDVDGFEVLETLKGQDTTKSIPIVMISNLGQAEDVTQAVKKGAVDYLVKSDLSLDKVVEKVRTYLEKKK